MSSTAAKLNLRPQERRLIAFVGIVVFVVLNIWFVWPHFGDWTLISLRRERARKTLETYQAERSKTKAYQVKLRELESAGSSVIPEEQELDLVRFVDARARQHGLLIIQLVPRPMAGAGTQTNRFFEEQDVSLHATSDNEQLIDFLLSLASTNSLIRVKDLSLKTSDVGATRLDEQMTLVASYQRRTPARVSAQPATPIPAAPAPTSKPVTGTKPTGAQSKTNRPALTGPGATHSATNRTNLPRTRQTNQPVKKL